MLVYMVAAALAVVVETPLSCWKGQNRGKCSEGAFDQTLEHIERTTRFRVKDPESSRKRLIDYKRCRV
jgi:hypothetical protein